MIFKLIVIYTILTLFNMLTLPLTSRDMASIPALSRKGYAVMTGILLTPIVYIAMRPNTPITFVFTLSAFAAIAAYDYRLKEISNGSLIVLMLSVIVHYRDLLTAGYMVTNMLASITLAAIFIGVFALAKQEIMGAGDIKLMIITAIIAPVTTMITFILFATITMVRKKSLSFADKLMPMMLVLMYIQEVLLKWPRAL